MPPLFVLIPYSYIFVCLRLAPFLACSVSGTDFVPPLREESLEAVAGL